MTNEKPSAYNACKSIFKATPLTRKDYTQKWIELITHLERNKTTSPREKK